MKIFIDTANVEAIKKWEKTGIIDGITSNPTLLSKEGGDPKKQVLEICKLMAGKDVSVEVTEKKPSDVYKQAKEIAKLADNIVVKIPCHLSYYPVIHRLSQEGIKLNITLVFTVIQGMMMCKLGVKYISPFIGRWDDIDVDGIALLDEMRIIIDQYNYSTQLLAASLRNTRHVHDAIIAGADVGTIPVPVLEKITRHPLTDQGIMKFDADWQKMGIKQFP